MKEPEAKGRATDGRRVRPSPQEVLFAGIGALEAGEERFEALKKRGRHVVQELRGGGSAEKAGRQRSAAARVARYLQLDVDARVIIPHVSHPRAAPAAPQMTELIESMTPADVPTAATVLQARRNSAARMAVAREFGLLSADEVAELRGSTAANRSALASRWKQEGRLLAVQHHGRDRFPGFQLDAEGRPVPAIADIVARLGQGWETALWLVASNPDLDDDRPVDRLRDDPAAVIAAAEREAEAVEY